MSNSKVIKEVEGIYLEHTKLKLINTHSSDRCAGRTCTLHNRSDHSMRHLPQHWRGDRGFMERMCEHNVGHPDPDEYMADVWVHGCDGCCQ